VHGFGRDGGGQLFVVAGPRSRSAEAFTDHGSFADVTVQELRGIEPSLSFTSEPSTDPYEASVATTPSTVGIAVRSGRAPAFWIRSGADGTTAFGQGEPRTGVAALGASALSWS
jgi:hypothetical protein